MVSPGSRLQGASANGVSVDGSAAALVSAPRGAVLIAPATTTPRPSSARRSIRPLPATAPTAVDLVLRKRLTEPLMSSSLSAPFRGRRYAHAPLRGLCHRGDKVTVASFSIAGGRSAALMPIIEQPNHEWRIRRSALHPAETRRLAPDSDRNGSSHVIQQQRAKWLG